MDELVFIPSAILGMLLIGAHAVACYRSGSKFSVVFVISAVLYSAGIVGGILLAASTFVEHLAVGLASIKLYTFIAGLAITTVSVQAVKKDLLNGD